MDKRVDEDKDPNGSRHVTNASPHAHHGTSMVVGLESGAGLALGQDDKGIEDLVELAEVEDPTVVRQTLGPHTTTGTHGVGRSRSEASVDAVGLVVVQRVGHTGFTVEMAESVGRGSDAVRAKGVRETPLQTVEHAPAGPGGVDGEEDIVENDEVAEYPRLADSPGLLVVGEVVAIGQLDSDGVGESDANGHASVEGSAEDALGDVEREGHRGRLDARRGDGSGSVDGGEGEQARVGEAPDQLRLDLGRHAENVLLSTFSNARTVERRSFRMSDVECRRVRPADNYVCVRKVYVNGEPHKDSQQAQYYQIPLIVLGRTATGRRSGMSNSKKIKDEEKKEEGGEKVVESKELGKEVGTYVKKYPWVLDGSGCLMGGGNLRCEGCSVSRTPCTH